MSSCTISPLFVYPTIIILTGGDKSGIGTWRARLGSCNDSLCYFILARLASPKWLVSIAFVGGFTLYSPGDFREDIENSQGNKS